MERLLQIGEKVVYYGHPDVPRNPRDPVQIGDEGILVKIDTDNAIRTHGVYFPSLDRAGRGHSLDGTLDGEGGWWCAVRELIPPVPEGPSAEEEDANMREIEERVKQISLEIPMTGDVVYFFGGRAGRDVKKGIVVGINGDIEDYADTLAYNGRDSNWRITIIDIESNQEYMRNAIEVCREGSFVESFQLLMLPGRETIWMHKYNSKSVKNTIDEHIFRGLEEMRIENKSLVTQRQRRRYYHARLNRQVVRSRRESRAERIKKPMMFEREVFTRRVRRYAEESGETYEPLIFTESEEINLN